LQVGREEEMERVEEVRRIAYQIWEEEGHPPGRALDHWLKAEDLWQHDQEDMLEHIQRDVESY